MCRDGEPAGDEIGERLIVAAEYASGCVAGADEGADAGSSAHEGLASTTPMSIKSALTRRSILTVLIIHRTIAPVRAALLLFVTVLMAGACKSSQGATQSGEQIFSAVCSRCHGPDGHGGVGVPPPRNFHDSAFQAQRTDADLMNDIRQGKSNAMPAFGNAFTDDQIKQLVSKVRSFDDSRGGSR